MRQVAAALGVSKTTVSEIAMFARDADVDWPLASTLSDDELQARLYPPPRPRSTTRQEPEYAALHQELKRRGVTLQLLWEVKLDLPRFHGHDGTAFVATPVEYGRRGSAPAQGYPTGLPVDKPTGLR